MITLKQYAAAKSWALAKAKQRLKGLTDRQRLAIAEKTGLSLSGVNSYRFGNGTCLETALMIIETKE